MRAEIRPDLVQGALDSGVDIERMQIVQEQEALDERVLDHRVHDLRAGRALLGEDLGDSGQAIAIQADQQSHELVSDGSGVTTARPERGEQRLYLLTYPLHLSHEALPPRSCGAWLA